MSPPEHASGEVATAPARYVPRQGWFWRREIPTWCLAAAIYGFWFSLVWFHDALPWWLIAPAAAYVTAWHFNFQHEAIHGWRSAPRWLRTAMVWPPIGLWLPFEMYRRNHSIHHLNARITVPGQDPESFYHSQSDWDQYPAVWRSLLQANQTMVGRLLLGPWIRWRKLISVDAARLVRGDFGDGWIWARHIAASGAIMAFVTQIAGMPWWQYLLYFVYGGMMLGMLRPFLEHRWGEKPYERIASVESNVVFGVLWLWNNLHIVHHLHPTMPWYDIPGYYRANREHLLALNGGFVYSGYLDLTKRYLIRPTFVPVHPNV